MSKSTYEQTYPNYRKALPLPRMKISIKAKLSNNMVGQTNIKKCRVSELNKKNMNLKLTKLYINLL